MIGTNNMSDASLVKGQYQAADGLALRKGLHEKYSVNKTGFQRWMFEQYPFRPEMRVLELGSGRGELWDPYFESERLQSFKMKITLSDFAEGMAERLRQKYEGREGFSVRQIDITDIPFENNTFDLIIANAMLYHVRDIDKALSEVRRVLNADGLFFCSTLGENGMTRYLYEALDALAIPHDPNVSISFTLQNGAPLLEKQFARVERRDYEDALAIDRVEDYVDYIYSMASMQGLDPKKYPVLLDYFNSKKKDGYLHVPKEYGMFVSREGRGS